MSSNRKEFFSMFYGSLSNYDSIDTLKEIAIKSKPISMSFDHRLALTSWFLWERVLNKHPNLITFDAHRDLTEENELKRIMKQIDNSSMKTLDPCIFEMLDRRNDTHINMACNLGVLKNVFVISNDLSDDDYCIHKSRVRVFDDLVDSIISIMSKEDYILDIDLDYFFDKSDDTNLFCLNESRLQSFLEKKLVFPNNLVGITVAIEPRYCGGIVNAIRVYEKIEHKIFNMPVFRDYYQEELAVLNEVVNKKN